ncbi:hypothetical protein DMENIID0001_055640 [Sergentomyia squamirostris]
MTGSSCQTLQNNNMTTASMKRPRDDKASSGQKATKQTKLDNYWLANVPTSNPFDPLNGAPEEVDMIEEKAPERPPPIFVHGVDSAKSLEELVNKHAGQTCRMTALQNNTVKIQVQTIDAYRSLLKDLKDKKTDMHSYQPKSERTLRVVIKNLHHSTSTEDITSALLEQGHNCKRTTRDSNVVCVNCLQAHPANYRGCSVHQQLKQRSTYSLRQAIQQRNRDNRGNFAENFPRTLGSDVQNQNIERDTMSYAAAARGDFQRQNREPPPDREFERQNIRLSSDISNLSAIIEKLANQMSTMLNMMSSMLARMPITNP